MTESLMMSLKVLQAREVSKGLCDDSRSQSIRHTALLAVDRLRTADMGRQRYHSSIRLSVPMSGQLQHLKRPTDQTTNR